MVIRNNCASSLILTCNMIRAKAFPWSFVLEIRLSGRLIDGDMGFQYLFVPVNRFERESCVLWRSISRAALS
jgi:hypothetical protein